MDLKEFKAFIEISGPKRAEAYGKLMAILDTGNFEYRDMIMILDWLNAQVILGIIPDEKQALITLNILYKSTKKMIRANKNIKIEGDKI